MRVEVDLWPEHANGDIGHWEREAYHYGESGNILTATILAAALACDYLSNPHLL